MKEIIIIFTSFFILRLTSLYISVTNEKRLKKSGAVQYGKLNSALLTMAHIAYYASCLYEAYVSQASFNAYSKWGVFMMLFSYIVLFYVIYKLKNIWTLKVYIAPNHQIDNSFLFRTIKHPNYFLNIIPELIGVSLLCNAWKTLLFGLPAYGVLLTIRIIQEEKAMQNISFSSAPKDKTDRA